MVNEPRKLGHVKVNELIQVMYCDRVELRGISSCCEVLQIFTEAVGPERSESRKDDPCCGRQANLVRQEAHDRN